jgi:hypothetical protein
MLSDWKVQQPNRDVVLVAGASSLGFALTSEVEDLKMRTKFSQYVIGPITAPVHMNLAPSMAGSVGDNNRFHFQHKLCLPRENNFALMQLAAAEGRDPVVAVQHLGQVFLYSKNVIYSF